MSRIDKIPTKVLLIIVFVLLTGVVFLAKAKHTPDTVQAWWNETWTYRQAIDIGWTGSNLTDFQVSFDIGTSALINAGKMQSNCNDIRVTDSSGNLLAHWIEENNPGCNATTDTKIWTRLPSLPDGGSTIYVYYGNSSAGNTENGNNVFEIFDDFNESSLDMTKWYDASTGNGSYSLSSGYVELIGGGAGCHRPFLRSLNQISDKNIIIDYRASATNSMSQIKTIMHWDGTSYGTYCEPDNGYNSEDWQQFTQFRIVKVVSGSASSIGSTTPSIGDTNWHTWNFSYYNEKLSLIRDGTTTVSATDTQNFTNTFIALSARESYGNSRYDNIRVRKSASSDPTSTPASEEVTPAPVAYWKFDEGVGTTAHDSSGQNHGNFGTGSSAPSWQSEDMCISGKCLSFDGNDYLNANTSISSWDDFTATGWFKLSPASSTGEIIVIGNSSSGGTGIAASITSTGAIRITHHGVAYGNTGPEVDDNNWHFLVLTHQGNTTNLYLDGYNLKSTYTGNSSQSTYVNIGSFRKSSAWQSFVSGFIDEVKVYPYARTVSQIKADYAAGLSGMGGNSPVNIGGDSTGKSLSDGLVGYWNMDTGTGTTIADLSGNGNTGTFGTGDSAPAWSIGKYGIGTSFDGSNDYALVNNSTSLNISGPITFGGWIKLNSCSNESFIFKNSQYSLNFHNDSGVCKVTYADSSIWNYTTFGYHGLISTGAWHHVIATKDNNNIVTIYVDGTSIVSKSFGSAITTTDNNIYIGSYSTLYYWFHGIIDEVRIYNRALSTSEVQTLYNWAPGPILHLNMDENTGTVAYDTSGNSNNGNLGTGNSAPSWTQGKYGSALSFDGNDYTSLGNPANRTLDFETNDFTISLWLKTNSRVNSPFLIQKNATNNQSYGIYLHAANGYPYVYLKDSDSTTDASLGSTALDDNLWHHLEVVFNRNSTTKTYVDGIQTSVNRDISSEAGSISNSGNFEIGKQGLTRLFNGLIDDVRIYNYARTPKQILEDMSTRGGSASGGNVTIPIAHWSFDEGYGTSANDKVGNNTATFGTGTSAPTWTNNGKVGKALSFNDGENDTIIATDPSDGSLDLETGKNISWSTWIKISGQPTGQSCVIHKMQGDWNSGYYVHFNNSYILNWKVFNGTIYQTWAATTDLSSYNNQWVYVAGTFTENNSIKLYINGQLTDSQIVNGSGRNSGAPFSIGNYNTGNWGFNGLIDEVKIYNYALSADEVKQDYNSGSTLVMGQSSSNTGSTAAAGSSTQEYCIPGSTDPCSPPVAEWNFNEKIGTTTYDSSGNNHSGSLINNPTWKSSKDCKQGGCLNFSGTSYIRSTTSPELDIAGPITIEAWVKPNTGTGQQGIIGTYGHDTAYSLYIRHSAGSDIGFWVNSDGTNRYQITGTLTYGTWNHIVGTWDGTYLKIYLNNNLLSSTYSNRVTSRNFQGVYIGYNSSIGSPNYFDGLIDQVRIYNYARTPAQVAWDYNRGAPIAHWKFDKGEGTTAFDSSGNNLHGTLGTGDSAPTWTTGKLNNALSFDGNDKIQIDYNSIFNMDGNSVTLTCWINPTSTADSKVLVGKRLGNEWDYSLQLYQSKIRADYWDSTSTRHRLDTTNSYVTAGSWQQVSIVINHLTNKIYYYYNGKLVETIDDSVDITNNLTELYIGYDPQSSSSIYNGLIDDVQIYNYALTSDQIKTLYNNGAVSFQ